MQFLNTLKNFSQKKEDIIITYTTFDFIEMCLNWYHSLTKIGLNHNVAVVCLDKKAYDMLQDNNIFSVLYEMNRPNRTSQDWIENAKFIKPKLHTEIYKNIDTNLIHLDTDIVFFRDFLLKVKETAINYDAIMCSDRRFDMFHTKRVKNENITVNHNGKDITNWGLAEQAKYGEKNGAIFYLPNDQNKKKKMLTFLNTHLDSNILKAYPTGTQDGSLQTITNQLIKTANVNIGVLDAFEFPNGSLWKVPYLREYVKDSCYLVHYNFHSHADPRERFIEKVKAMKQHGHWYM